MCFIVTFMVMGVAQVVEKKAIAYQGDRTPGSVACRPGPARGALAAQTPAPSGPADLGGRGRALFGRDFPGGPTEVGYGVGLGFGGKVRGLGLGCRGRVDCICVQEKPL